MKNVILEIDLRILLSFVTASIGRGAITFDEFLEWLDLMILTYDELPPYFFDLCDSKSINDVYRIEGRRYNHVIGNGLNNKEAQVLWGITAKRGLYLDEDCITPKTALKRLEQYPHVVERFKKTFPFIKLDF